MSLLAWLRSLFCGKREAPWSHVPSGTPWRTRSQALAEIENQYPSPATDPALYGQHPGQPPDLARMPLIKGVIAEDPKECSVCGRKRVVSGNECSDCRHDREAEFRDRER